MTNASAGPTLARIQATARAALDAAPDVAVDPVVLRFLVRAYALGLDDGDASPLEKALAVGLAAADRAVSVGERIDWLLVCADALSISDDDRVRIAAARLCDELLAAPAGHDTAAAAFQLDARLGAASALGDGTRLSAAVDDLEALVAHTYAPGEPLASWFEHGALAHALLTAFDITGRLPYAMLAEELLQTAQRTWTGMYDEAAAGRMEPACVLVGALQRLARLHADDDYRARAVLPAGAEYAHAAAQLVSALDGRLACEPAAECARFGLAVLER